MPIITHWDVLRSFTEQHETYDKLFNESLDRVFYGSGSLKQCIRHYIALMAATRHRCFYLMDLHKREFERAGGEPEWLLGVSHADVRMKALDEINTLLAHQPWLFSANCIIKFQQIAAVGSATDRTHWTLAELTQAVFILIHTHILSSLIFAFGGIEPSDLTQAEIAFLKCDDEEYLARNKENDSLSEVEELLRRMAKLEAVPNEGAEQDATFNSAISDGTENAGSESPESDHNDEPLYSADPHFTYVDFNSRRDKSVKTFKTHEFSWDHGFNLIADLNGDLQRLAGLLDEKFLLIQQLTYSFMGTYRDVNTHKYRRAVWNYIQALFGVRYDDYDYSEVNVLLDRHTKTFIKHIACTPYKITEDMRRKTMSGFKYSEKVHVILLVAEARMQSTLLYYTRALTNFYTMTMPNKRLQRRALD